MLDVVRNRVESSQYPDTYCGVVKQRKQFSWYNDMQFDLPADPLLWESYILDRYKGNTTELMAWQSSFLLALDHYLSDGIDHTNGSQFYMTVELFTERGYLPFKNTTPGHVVGNHIFFKQCKRGNKCYHF